MRKTINEKRALNPEMAKILLAEYGTKIDLEEAGIILEFMYKIGKLTIENFHKLKSQKAV